MSVHNGPWKAIFNIDPCPVVIGGAPNEIEICALCGNSEEDRNAARLMAAAPDLLDLVKQLMDEYRPDAAHDEAYYPVWALADAIIKDIEG